MLFVRVGAFGIAGDCRRQIQLSSEPRKASGSLLGPRVLNLLRMELEHLQKAEEGYSMHIYTNEHYGY